MALNSNSMLDTAILTQLGQVRPDSTSAVSIYTLGSKKIVWATSLMITNVTASDVAFSVYHDADGTSYSESTAIAFAVPLEANGAVEWSFDNYLPLVVTGGSIGVQSDSANALTFTLNGLLRNVA